MTAEHAQALIALAAAEVWRARLAALEEKL